VPLCAKAGNDRERQDQRAAQARIVQRHECGARCGRLGQKPIGEIV
jgi:hypothetical protein